MGLGRTICFLSALACLASCGPGQAAKEPPSVKPELVLSMFHALQDGDHAAALEKIRRLRELKDSAFLANLELQEAQNLIVKQMQSKLDDGDVDAALDICSKGITSSSRNERLLLIKDELLRLKKIQGTVGAVAAAETWTSLARASAALKTLALSYPPANPLLSVATGKLAEAKGLMLREQRLSTMDLALEIISGHQTDRRIKDVMLLSLSLADPENPAIVWTQE